MPRKTKNSVDKAVVDNQPSSITKRIQQLVSTKKYEDIEVVGNYLKSDPIAGWVSTGAHLLDMAISFPSGLGLPLPALVEIVGQESSAKSLMAYTILGNIQEQGGWSALIDTEGTFTHDYGRLARLDLNEDLFLYTKAGLLRECFDYIDDIIDQHVALHPDRPLGICLDSFAAATMKEERDNSGETARALQARLISRWLREGLTRRIYGKKIIVIFCNQLRSTMAISPWDPKSDSFGGAALKYYSRVRIKLTRSKILKREEAENPYGIRCNAEIIKNKVAAPYRKASIDMRFSSGIEDYFPVMDFLADHNMLRKSGVYFYWNDKAYYPNALRELLLTSAEDWQQARTMCVEAAYKEWAEALPAEAINKES
jgi:recombination protein RecA